MTDKKIRKVRSDKGKSRVTGKVLPYSKEVKVTSPMEGLAKAKKFGVVPKNKNFTSTTEPLISVTKRESRGKDFKESGKPGLQAYSGHISEEFLPELRDYAANRIYTEMKDNDATIGAMLYTIEQLIQRTSMTIKAPADAENKEDINKKIDLIESGLHDMSRTWTHTISEILTFLPFGYAWMEVTLKNRQGEHRNPKFNSIEDDGLIGWRGIELRGQDSTWRWEIDEQGEIIALWQRPAPAYDLIRIPAVKSLLFRLNATKNNPEGRPLTLDTVVPTPSGWTTMEEISTGDQVYDEEGKIRYVTGKSEIFKNRNVYEIEFSDKTLVKADEIHLWNVTTHNDRFHNKSSRTLTTKEMYEAQNKANQHYSAGVSPIISGVEQILPDPYIIGYWLGDGTINKGNISVQDKDFSNIKDWCNSKGYGFKRLKNYNARIYGFDRELKLAGVMNKKHIPVQYLRASTQQRLELLQGLMDSDGSCSFGNDKSCIFANTNLDLINGIAELIRSLGMKATITLSDRTGDLGGIINGKQIISTKDCFKVSFYPDMHVFKLKRKQAKQDLDVGKRTKGNFIKSITKINNQDTVCIEVDSPSHLFLCGESFVPTHNSLLRNAYRTWFFKKRFEEIEGIAFERDLTGLPVLTPPEGFDLWNPEDDNAKILLQRAEDIVRNIRMDQHMGVVLPNGWKLELMTSGQRSLDTTVIIGRLEQRMAVTVLADMLLIGQDRVGSFALVSAKVQLFSAALQSILTNIADVFNRDAIPRLMRANGFSQPYPIMHFGPVESIDLKSLAEFFNKTVASGIITPTDELESFVRQQAGIPTISPTDTKRPIPGLEPDSPEDETKPKDSKVPNAGKSLNEDKESGDKK